MKSRKNNVYNQMQRLADLTATMVLSGKLARAGRFLNAVERIFISGNAQMRSAIANVFIYKLSTVLQLHRFPVQAILPPVLYREHIKQINAF